MATQFTATVKPSAGDYTSLYNATVGLANNITAADIKVFSISAYSTPTIAAGDTVLGQTSGATGVCVLVNAARTQILIKTIAVASFLSGEIVQKTADANTNVTLSNAGDSPIIGIECYSMSDTTVVVISGYTTGSSNYLRIYTPKSERHQGKWDDTKYRLEIVSASNTRAITCNIAYARIDGLQISVDSTSTNWVDAIGFTGTDGSSAYIIVSNCIVKGLNNNYGSGIYINNVYAFAYNNIIYDFTSISTSYGIYTNNANATLNVYNNTIINCDYGIRGTSYVLAINNLLYLCATAPTNNLTAANCSYNATNAASLGYVSQTGDRTSQTFTFINELSDDFHLAPTDAGARNYGLTDPSSGVFSDDINGRIRPGQLIWDIGADEYFPTSNYGYIIG